MHPIRTKWAHDTKKGKKGEGKVRLIDPLARMHYAKRAARFAHASRQLII